MATYSQIQQYVRATHGFVPMTAWIAHVQELHRLPVTTAPNRHGTERRHPCPPPKRAAIEATLRHVGLLDPHGEAMDERRACSSAVPTGAQA